MTKTANTVYTHDKVEVRIVTSPSTKYYIEYLDTDGYLNTVKVHFDTLEDAQHYVETTVVPWLPVKKISDSFYVEAYQ